MRIATNEGMTMREARAEYFRANQFGDDGGYGDAWVDFSLGPVPFPFPNTPARIRAVRYHDLHHVLTGYDTTFGGELEISAWEIGAGCKGFAAAWVLNLGGTAAGAFGAPAKTFAAFARGRKSRSLYAEPFEPLLDKTVGELRGTHIAGDFRPGVADVALFVLTVLAGMIVGLSLFALLVPLAPFGLIASAWRRRQLAEATACALREDSGPQVSRARSSSSVGSGSSSAIASR